MPDWIVGRYRVLKRLGEGGMGQTYVAVMQGAEGFRRLVVLKRKSAAAVALSEYLRAEARIGGELSHKNLVAATDYFRDDKDGTHYIALEFVHGIDLASLRRGYPRLPLRIALYIIIEVATGLHHAHEAKDAKGVWFRIVHRDVSPDNIFISKDGLVKVGDFGIAAVHTGIRKPTVSLGEIKGKWGYVSPEMCKPALLNGKPLDRRADIYALGVILYELLSGSSPFGSFGSEYAALMAIADGAKKPLMEAAPSLLELPEGPALISLVERMISLQPDDRPSTCQEVVDELESIMEKASTNKTRLMLKDLVQPLVGPEPHDDEASPAPPSDGSPLPPTVRGAVHAQSAAAPDLERTIQPGRASAPVGLVPPPAAPPFAPQVPASAPSGALPTPALAPAPHPAAKESGEKAQVPAPKKRNTVRLEEDGATAGGGAVPQPIGPPPRVTMFRPAPPANDPNAVTTAPRGRPTLPLSTDPRLGRWAPKNEKRRAWPLVFGAAVLLAAVSAAVGVMTLRPKTTAQPSTAEVVVAPSRGATQPTSPPAAPEKPARLELAPTPSTMLPSAAVQSPMLQAAAPAASAHPHHGHSQKRSSEGVSSAAEPANVAGTAPAATSNVVIEPPASKCKIDGADVGDAPIDRHLSVGDHELTAIVHGSAVTMPFTVRAGEVIRLRPEYDAPMNAAMDDYVHTHYEVAVGEAQRALAVAKTKSEKNNANKIIAATSCFLKNQSAALRSYSQIDDTAIREFVTYVCGRNGITFQ